jgi:hypothetical protein
MGRKQTIFCDAWASVERARKRSPPASPTEWETSDLAAMIYLERQIQRRG